MRVRQKQEERKFLSTVKTFMRSLAKPLPDTFDPPEKFDTAPRSVAGRKKALKSQRDRDDSTLFTESGKDRVEVSTSNFLADWTSTTWVWVIVVPIIVACLLIILVPSFVKTTEDGKKLDHYSVVLWTLIISLIVWILFFGFAKCKTC